MKIELNSEEMNVAFVFMQMGLAEVGLTGGGEKFVSSAQIGRMEKLQDRFEAYREKYPPTHKDQQASEDTLNVLEKLMMALEGEAKGVFE